MGFQANLDEKKCVKGYLMVEVSAAQYQEIIAEIHVLLELFMYINNSNKISR